MEIPFSCKRHCEVLRVVMGTVATAAELDGMVDLALRWNYDLQDTMGLSRSAFVNAAKSGWDIVVDG